MYMNCQYAKKLIKNKDVKLGKLPDLMYKCIYSDSNGNKQFWERRTRDNFIYPPSKK